MIRLYPSTMPFWVKWFFPKLTYRYPVDKKQIFITFDDGPEPDVTPWVLDVLKREQVKATFFCVGNQIEKHPDIFKRIITDGHRIGNHTFRHENGWRTPAEAYKKSIDHTEKLIAQYTTPSKLFRPPYGRITPAQVKLLKRAGYKIIMWSVLTGDFSNNLDTGKALTYLKKHIRPGDITVFHDSRKAFENLKTILPDYIRYLKKERYKFEILS